MDTIDLILQQLRALATQADDVGRHRLLDGLRDIQSSLETPHDTLSHFSGLHLKIAAARIGEDLKLFEILAERRQSWSVGDLAAKTNAAPLFLGRLLRYLASVNLIKESGEDTFTANGQTHTLAQPGYRGGIYHFFDNCGPVFQALPAFLAGNKYQDITDATKTAFQTAFPTDLPAFQWLPTQPERFGPLQQVMMVQGAAAVPWFSVFPFEKELSDFAGRHVFVDIGGGFGHQCVALKQAYPQLKDKIVLQDLPQTLEHLPPPFVAQLDGIEKLAHNFFEPQPIKEAKFYYLRNVLHDWPDETCIEILSQISIALGSESQILIDEMVLPNVGVTWEATTIDLTMMSSLGSRERTLKEWRALLDSAGLKIQRIDTYTPRRHDSIIQVARK
ncbi:o-methyltransferas-like protein [Truncatella angustata]|uniref:O-methyltransferas-like protein n=1 Tax=Truncatella angustata TaxID=152316 RepID=A0A9P8UHM3_9PEZI|nr:o-methyltransferase-like protein [Truncatella angustata]KAH6652311.1 o-methyltransferas-like protein [Truncatella angustata]KAH8205110.1 hypothetical protein TruAng_000675 [Truncatella angustata]